MSSNPPRLLDRVREALRRTPYALRTEDAYVGWIRRFILFPGKQHPQHLGHAEVQAVRTDLAVSQHVAASTQNQALSALCCLSNEVLPQPREDPIDSVRAKQPTKRPTVLTHNEVTRVRDALRDVHHLMAGLLYGSGLRLMEGGRRRARIGGRGGGRRHDAARSKTPRLGPRQRRQPARLG